MTVLRLLRAAPLVTGAEADAGTDARLAFGLSAAMSDWTMVASGTEAELDVEFDRPETDVAADPQDARDVRDEVSEVVEQTERAREAGWLFCSSLAEG